jgi:D-3-phosphoglycerate dehydrogenase
MLAAVPDVVKADTMVRMGDWSKVSGHELGALTVGLVGFGDVGRRVAVRLSGFDSTVLAYDPFVDVAAMQPLGVKAAALEELLEMCDVVTLHRPGGVCVFDASAVARLRRGAVLVNTSRADLLDEEAVSRALHEGRLGAFASDVIRHESGRVSPLLSAPHTTFSPHCGASTVEAVDRLGRVAVEEMLNVLNGNPPEHRVA